jgi:membrane protease YdiL (CAAX protease family)
MLSYAGAGIYEEVLFRLLLLSALRWLGRQAELPAWGALALAGLVSALLFSLAHHVGLQGEVFDAQVFLFRTLAGLYFAALYLCRGFGIAVGAHAGYDVLVGLMLDV